MIYNFLAKTIPTFTGEVSVRNIVQLLEFSIYSLINVALVDTSASHRKPRSQSCIQKYEPLTRYGSKI